MNTKNKNYTLSWEYDGNEMDPSIFLNYHNNRGLSETLNEFVKESLENAGAKGVKVNKNLLNVSVKQENSHLPETFTTEIATSKPLEYHQYSFYLEPETRMIQKGGELLEAEIPIEWRINGGIVTPDEIYRLNLNATEDIEEDWDFGLTDAGYIRPKLDETYDTIHVFYDGQNIPVLPSGYTQTLEVYKYNENNENEEDTEKYVITVVFLDLILLDTQRNVQTLRYGFHNGYYGINYNVRGRGFLHSSELELTQEEKSNLVQTIYARAFGELMLDGITEQSTLNESLNRFYVHFQGYRSGITNPSPLTGFTFDRQNKPSVQITFDPFKETNFIFENNTPNNNNNNNWNNNNNNNNQSNITNTSTTITPQGNVLPAPEDEPPAENSVNTPIVNDPTVLRSEGGQRRKNKKTRRAGTRLRKSRVSNARKGYRRKTLRKKRN
jgi:hypothetical protein